MKVSICASAARPQQWLETYNSLKQNNIEWELIYVGPNIPNFSLSSNFIYIQTNVKPAQCYEIAFRKARGELIHWTADDTIYPPNALENMYSFWKSFNDNKVVAAFRTVEDGKDITEVHRFRGKDQHAPRMAPFGVVNRELFNNLGGYDRRFICGQSENDVVMRFLSIGGRVEISSIPVYVNHNKVHTNSTVFRSGFYHEDRKVLESAWVKNGVIQSERLYPVESFVEENIITITQDQKGIW
jgi:hypothetical protein